MTTSKLQPTLEIPRTEPPLVMPEVVSLRSWLDFHRQTFQLKCAGLTDEELKQRAVAPSTLTLLGLARHLTDVERGWFAETLAGESVIPFFYSADDPDGDFDNLDAVLVAEVWRRYLAAIEHSRRIYDSFDTADDMCRNENEKPVNVRWVMMHMIEEYARHNGHADLLREAIDGARGD